MIRKKAKIVKLKPSNQPSTVLQKNEVNILLSLQKELKEIEVSISSKRNPKLERIPKYFKIIKLMRRLNQRLLST